MSTGSKNVVAIQKSTKKIEDLTSQFKLKRISYEAFVQGLNEAMSEMTSKRDYLEYMRNIGYFEKFQK
jgi:hypothetical protein